MRWFWSVSVFFWSIGSRFGERLKNVISVIETEVVINSPLFNLGFRPFFLGAAIFAVISMSLWMAVYVFRYPIPLYPVSAFQWHAHEMVYGYALAVVAGFLLTAVKNWTGIQTLDGAGLGLLFSLWAAARLLWLFGTTFVSIAAVLDLSFITLLVVSITVPILRAKHWTQLFVVLMVVLLGVANLCFYLGVAGYLEAGVFLGVYGGLYLILGLILIIGRRVIPFFIERGVDYKVELSNHRWIDVSVPLLYLLFATNELFADNSTISVYAALALFVICTLRLIGWHTPGIWKPPLLWSLFLSFAFICLGFLLFFLSGFIGISKLVAIHAFSVGGLGTVTLAMMARVALGHTGRSVATPSPFVTYSLVILLASAVIRVAFPLIAPHHYMTWMAASQILWILAFALFAVIYAPYLTRARVDGKPG